MKLSKLLLIALALPAVALSGVNLKNGNFYISYTDVIAPGGGKDLRITRTYNSKSTHSGWFGFGWGSAFETKLTVSADGSVIVHENGAGATTRFVPKTQINPRKAAQKIVAEMKKRTSLSNAAATNYIKKLTNNAELRQEYAKKFKVTAHIPSGSMLYSNTRGHQTMKKTRSGFERRYSDGKVEYFNKKGQITKIKDKSGYSITLKYDRKTNVLASIKDSQTKQLFFSWYPNGRVKHIWSTGKKKSKYTYKDKNLVVSTDVAGNTYKYSYDSNHNMTSIKYKDGSSMKMSYNNKTQFIEKVMARNGSKTHYKYGSDSKKPELKYWTTVKRFRPNSKKANVSKYMYFIKNRKDGSRYTHRVVTHVGNIKTDTTYSECCSLPLVIKRGNHVTKFKYNKKGLLTKKSSSKGDFVKLSYHKKMSKVTRVETNSGWTSFEYNKGGKLTRAKNNKNESVFLLYDLKGRITKLIQKEGKSKAKKILTFKYNSLGKPVEIAMQGVGKMNVDYDNYGGVKRVNSKGGKKMADKVTRTFLSLLQIVKPAGVNLSV